MFRAIAPIFNTGVSSLFDFLLRLQTSAPCPRQFVLLDGVHDWRHFFQPCLPGVAGQAQGRHFLIQKENGALTVRAKSHVSLAAEWGDPVVALSSMPTGLPPPLPNTLDAVYPQVKLGIDALLSSHLLSPPAKQWFKHVLEKKTLGAELKSVVRQPGVVGEAGFLTLGGATGECIAVSLIRAEAPAPATLPVEVKLSLQEQDPALLYAQQQSNGGAVALKNMPSTAMRLFKKDKVEGNADQDEEEESEKVNEQGEGKQEVSELATIPETEFTQLDLSASLPFHCFVVVQGRGKLESRRWQLAQYLGMADDSKDTLNIRFWGCEQNVDYLTARYRPAFGVTWRGGWHDVYEPQPGSKPSISTADLDEVLVAYSVPEDRWKDGYHVIPKALQEDISKYCSQLKSKSRKLQKSKPKSKRKAQTTT